MSRPTDSGRVIHSFIDDGPSILVFHAEGAIGVDARRTHQRGRVWSRGWSAMRARLRMVWPAAALVIVVGIAAAGGTTAPHEDSIGPSPVPATPARIASVAVDSPPALADPAQTSMAIAAETPWIVYTFGDRIRLVRADGSDDHVILADIGLRQRGASWSRDGRLVFEADFGAASQLWVANPDRRTGLAPDGHRSRVLDLVRVRRRRRVERGRLRARLRAPDGGRRRGDGERARGRGSRRVAPAGA